jgi:hypothetical protein
MVLVGIIRSEITVLKCSHSNAFKRAAEEREKAFKKSGARTTRAAQKAGTEGI